MEESDNQHTNTTLTTTTTTTTTTTDTPIPPPPPPVTNTITTNKKGKVKEEFFKLDIIDLKNKDNEIIINDNILFIPAKPVVYVPLSIVFNNNTLIKKKHISECKWTVGDHDVTSKLDISEKAITYTPTRDQANMDLKIHMKLSPTITHEKESHGNFISKLFKSSSSGSVEEIIINYTHKILFENSRETLKIKESSNKENQFKIITFNILADLYVSDHYYSYLPPYALKWNTYRSHLLIPQILQYDADVACMQEVDTMYVQLFSEMNKKGYQHFPEYLDSKTNTPMQLKYREGCFIFFKKSRFNFIKGLPIDYRTIEQGNLIDTETVSKLMTDQIFKLVIGTHLHDSSHHVRHCLVLVEDKVTKEKMIFVSIHLYWGSYSVYQIQCVQIHLFSLILRKFIKDNKLDINIPIIICGDFNSSPDSSVYQYLTTGSMSNDDPNLTNSGQYPTASFSNTDTDNNSDESNDINSISHPFKLTSAYGLRPDGEPKFTTTTKAFCGNIDQIYVSDRFKVNTLLEVGEKQDYNILPSLSLASDHILLMSEVELNSK
ncbi:hypothetical protein DICPUDRAFT_50499 [Dictyostelium purpureum]|uniref:Endonuclease/exonuclease/phosphatase domain-containing protein n=1 Tax=Dictyostelium purpureum TaxID=5786 RepID=F0ZYN8_DICPU|nr:uncharacterized protein DICPUDRAFT_50499 [Dictyostelium purpureum]EGC30945.1 hypothetical protein DICPUDRAFT_50499 [Dictyostelium purpureum]|eukprot:XP_003292522.1 hypothetical protein DICPUDRAFT_50499 [Dictyostelium purpureum]